MCSCNSCIEREKLYQQFYIFKENSSLVAFSLESLWNLKSIYKMQNGAAQAALRISS